MSKKVSFDKQNMEAMLKGLNIAGDAVSGTIGPKGRNVYIKDNFLPEITNDGVSIATKIELQDPQEDAGAFVIRNVSSQQNDDVGDGTTTVALLTQSLVHECIERPENVMEVKESLKEAGNKALQILAKKSVKIKKDEIEKVALISAEDKTLAKIISEIIKKLGDKAVINVEDSKTFGTEYEIVEGYEASYGFLSPHFINDEKTGKAIHEDIPVFVTAKKISNITDIQNLFNKLKEEQIGKCAIVCDDISDDMLGIFVISKKMKTFDGVVIRTNKDTLEDIAGATGATIISDETGITFAKASTEHLGTAKKLICDKNTSVFVGSGMGAKIKAAELDKQAENEPNMFLKKIIKNRADKLRGCVAILKVGAPTDFERTYLRKKAEDAVKAVQAALEEGVVEGGGMALWRIASELEGKTIGEQILKKSLKEPLKKIISNAGKDYTEIIVNLPKEQGYDAKNDCYVNMFEKGILDPTKVERCALENAVSAASTFITTFATITLLPENDKK